MDIVSLSKKTFKTLRNKIMELIPVKVFDKGLITWLFVLAAVTLLSCPANAQIPADADWISYNRTLQGDRYSPLKEITTANARNWLSPEPKTGSCTALIVH
jgi:hypothetical protein